MIHYQLCCGQDHEFDGWFRNSAAFDAQAKRGLLECPECGDPKVRRALMAPALSRKGGHVLAAAEPPHEAAPAPEAAGPGPEAGFPTPAQTRMAGGRMPDHMRAMLQKLRTEIERNCDDVGENFAEEARAIHRGDSPRRGIYGETTPEQAEALAEDGIDIARIPWVPRADG